MPLFKAELKSQETLFRLNFNHLCLGFQHVLCNAGQALARQALEAPCHDSSE